MAIQLLVFETFILAPYLLGLQFYMQLTGAIELMLGIEMPRMVLVIQLQPTQLKCLR